MDWQMIVTIATDVTVVFGCIAIFIKPLRERVFGQKAIKDGQKCLLRSEIVRIYYRNLEHRTLRQYEYENLVSCYRAYIALGGNSFVKHIYDEMQEWKVVN